MSKRDEELDDLARKLQAPVDPYIEKPDELDIDVGGQCFLDKARMCGADCTAYGEASAPTAVERCTILATLTGGMVLLQDVMARLTRPAPSLRPSMPYATPPTPDPFPQRGRP